MIRELIGVFWVWQLCGIAYLSDLSKTIVDLTEWRMRILLNAATRDPSSGLRRPGVKRTAVLYKEMHNRLLDCCRPAREQKNIVNLLPLSSI
ncbi:hypothetical protein SISSUDRAFT_1043826 [Sistotremastrum suecicum HHB10207 ss-3]|uniref:Uncharacterized protein n=1 Tax=Sistotremastrum suecicum HHB10207 ss-3 TaxID=1314776 RepID=A0A166FJ42_9AGAM|nr:hypothetical protein SISSUDRAFT_1043826 [Sistotremastrum suecicum HHB10207 ss-3]